MDYMSRAKILVVDDEDMNIELFKGLLSKDYDIISATNGNEALLIIDKDPPDLILLDVMMPDMNGYEVCYKLKENPKTMLIPIIMVTALHGKEDKIKAGELYADEFLSKPVDDRELSTKIRLLLRVKQCHDALTGDLRFLS
jgi:DNA-binding response OmpR family regulator